MTNTLRLFFSTLIYFSVSILSFSQNITDYELGMKLEGNDIIHLEIGNIPGVLFLYPDKYGHIYAMGFVVSYDGKTPAKVSSHSLENLVDRLKNIYKIDFEVRTDFAINKRHYYGKYKGNQMVVSGGYCKDCNELFGVSLMINKL